MWAQVERILRQSATQIGDQVASFLPGLLVALLLIVVTVVAAVVVHALLLRALRGLEFDQWAERSGVAAVVGWPVAASPSQGLARLTYWTILFLGLLVSLTALNATVPSLLALTVFEYIPNLLAGLLVLVIGIIAARFLSRSALIGAVNMQIQSARLLSLAVKWLVLLVAVAMALAHTMWRGLDDPKSEGVSPSAVRLRRVAGLGLACWIAAIPAGRFLAYTCTRLMVDSTC